MKKNISILGVALFAVLFLSGCDKQTPQNDQMFQSGMQPIQLQSDTIEEVEVDTTEPLEGMDETTDTINEIDKLLQDSDSDLDEGSFSDSDLQL